MFGTKNVETYLILTLTTINYPHFIIIFIVMRKVVYLIILAALTTGCGNGSSDGMLSFYEMDTETAHRSKDAVFAPAAIQMERAATGIPSETKIIKSGNIGLIAGNLERTKREIDSLLLVHDGYYSNESFNDFEHESVYNLTIRIPAHSFEIFIEGVESAGDRLVSKNISARDVTEEFVDLEMRLTNRRNYLKRYNDLLQQARTVADILEIQEKIRNLEEEIESVEGRLNYLDGLVEYSTLYLTITKKKEFRFQPVQRDRFIERLKQSLSGGWFGLINFTLFIISLWPLWIVLAAVVIIWRRLVSP